jgi:3'-phosphoadenosine 5'-phosphosulfate sulfotransferase (PAPS reductase)/FAD synthetase
MIAVWFSRGAASAVAAKLTVDIFGASEEVRIVTNPVIEEPEDNLRFQDDVEKWLGVQIETALNPKYPNASAVEVWNDRKYMAGIAGAPCTSELKKVARQHWENINAPDWHVLGFTAEETKRHKRFTMGERSNVLPMLIWWGYTKQDCHNILRNAGIKGPSIYQKGFPNANCIGCVKAQSPTYWNLVRREYPQIFDARAEQSRRIGCKLVKHKGKRLYLDELDPNARGRSLKGLDFECGSFCEERPR